MIRILVKLWRDVTDEGYVRVWSGGTVSGGRSTPVKAPYELSTLAGPGLEIGQFLVDSRSAKEGETGSSSHGSGRRCSPQSLYGGRELESACSSRRLGAPQSKGSRSRDVSWRQFDQGRTGRGKFTSSGIVPLIHLICQH